MFIHHPVVGTIFHLITRPKIQRKEKEKREKMDKDELILTFQYAVMETL